MFCTNATNLKVLFFWDHQRQAAKTHRKWMRWHLYFRHQSSKAYETLRDSGNCPPSQRTPRDYTYVCKAATGYSRGVMWVCIAHVCGFQSQLCSYVLYSIYASRPPAEDLAPLPPVVCVVQWKEHVHACGKRTAYWLASYPGPLRGGGERRAWYTLFAHA